MKIAIDISSIIFGTGVSVYTKNLIENLMRVDQENSYILFGGSLRRFGEMKKIVRNYNSILNVKYSEKIYPIAPTLASIVWNKFHVLPIENLLGRIDVFHSSDWTQPPTSAFNVTTVHDLTPLLFPKLSHPTIVKTHTERIKWVKREVHQVIVPSETTASDLLKLGFQNKKINVIPEAVDPMFIRANVNQVKYVKYKYKITGPYLLAVGINSRKNTPRIIEAVRKVKSELNTKLVIVGQSSEAIKHNDQVMCLGHVLQEDMPALFTGAEAIVYPSLYEGFGLPILEGYACQTPVITSDVGSMKEIGRDAAVLVNPYSIEAIADGILTAIKEKDNIIKKGNLKLKNYSWERTALKTLEIYKQSVCK